LRLLLATLACVLCFTFQASSQMRKVHDDYQLLDVLRLNFLSPSEGYVAFTTSIGYTADSGRTFTRKEITLNNVDFNNYTVNVTFGFGINGVRAFSKDTLLVYGDYGLVGAILYSVNGGNTFKLIYHGNAGNLTSGFQDMVFAGNSATGFAIDQDRIMKSSDRGRNWSAVWPIPGTSLSKLQVIDANNYIAFTERFAANSRLLMSTDAGNTWEQRSLPTGKLHYAYFLNPQKGWIHISTSEGKLIYTTSDGGRNWTKVNTPETAIEFWKIQFIDNNTGFAIGDGYDVYKTTDGGKFWEKLLHDSDYYSDYQTHRDLQCLNSTQLWAGGTRGYLEMSTNSGGPTIPQAYFKVDTTGVFRDNVVHLNNYGKTDLTYEWFKNDTLVGTGYHATYVHNKYHLQDTIKLVVHNGVLSDTTIRYFTFPEPLLVTAFSPSTAKAGDEITIKGNWFYYAYKVTFGGQPAQSFRVIDNSTIRAVPAPGSNSGAILVQGPYGIDSLPGFKFLPIPVINSFTPQIDTAGSIITIRGAHFLSTKAVSFGGVPAARYVIVSDSVIRAVTGDGESGKIRIENNGGFSEIEGFAIKPIIRNFWPKVGTDAEVIEINGTGLGATKYVTVGDEYVASFEINSTNRITAILGKGATGKVAVAGPAGVIAQEGFTFFHSPEITGITPLSGPVGTTVTITGNFFNSNPDKNAVSFGPVRAIVTAASEHSLTVKVPAGAAYTPVTVSNNGLTGYSSMAFNVTFNNGGSITETSFAPRVDIPLSLKIKEARYGTSLKEMDIDGDGKTDVIVNDRNTLIALRNTTTGDSITFAAQQVLASLPRPENFVGNAQIIDFNGDGKLDIHYYQDSWYYVLINRSQPGTISFDPPTLIWRSGEVFADLDGDGKPDIASSGLVYRNLSSPDTLRFAWEQAANAPDQSRAAGDLDGDGKPEIIGAGYDSVYVWKNLSTKGEIKFVKSAAYYCGGAQYVTVGDADNDGKNDFAVSSGQGPFISFFRNTTDKRTGKLSFEEVRQYKPGAVPTSPFFRDVDGDNKIDLVYINASGKPDAKVSVMKNLSVPGKVRFSDRITFENERFSSAILVTDLNNDSKPDIMTAGNTEGVVSVFRNNVTSQPFLRNFTPSAGVKGTVITISGTNFKGVTAVNLGTTAAQSFTVVNDSTITAIAGEGSTGKIAVSSPAGSSAGDIFVYGFAPIIRAVTPASGPVGSSVVITGEHFSENPAANRVLFGSATATVLSASSTSLTVTVPTGTDYTPVSVTTNELTAYAASPFVTTYQVASDTLFTFSETTEVPYGWVLHVADLNNDNKPDIVAVKDDSLQIAANNSVPGNVSFLPHKTLPAPISPNAAQSADIDGDGKTDIIAINPTNKDFLVYLNTGNGKEINFRTVVISNSQMSYLDTYGYGIAIDDMDGDGKPDIAISSTANNSFSIYRNISTPGNPAFDTRQDFDMPTDAEFIAVKDLDGDGLAEIVSTNVTSISIFRNISTKARFNFVPVIDITTPNSSWLQQVRFGDMNNDNKPDIVVCDLNRGVHVINNNSSTGKFSFSSPVLYKMPLGQGSPINAFLSDLNGDSKPEVVVIHNGADYIYVRGLSVFRNTSHTNGAITLDAPREIPAALSLFVGSAVDIDSDGKQDLIASRTYPQNTVVLLNQLTDTVRKVVCPNAPATLSANITGQYYQWQQQTVNGFADISDNQDFAGANTPTLTLKRVPVEWQDKRFRCMVDDKYSSRFVLQLEKPLQPSVTAIASTDTICSGLTVFFRAISENGGPAPKYRWLVNGIPADTGRNTFTPAYLKNNDKVSVIMTSNAFCVSPASDTSEPVSITVRDLNPIVSVTDSIFVVSNYGNAPVLWQVYVDAYWQTASAPATGAAYTAYKSGTYRVKVGNDSCSWVSDPITFSVAPPPDPGRQDLHMYPNPVSDVFTINKLKLSDEWEKLFIMSFDGSQQLGTYDITGRESITINIQQLQRGMYLVVLRRKNGAPVTIRLMKVD